MGRAHNHHRTVAAIRRGPVAGESHDAFAGLFGTVRGRGKPRADGSHDTSSEWDDDDRTIIDRHFVLARVEDAAAFAAAFEHTLDSEPDYTAAEVAGDFEFCKAISDQDLEFYVITSDPEEALRQFRAAASLIDADVLSTEVHAAS